RVGHDIGAVLEREGALADLLQNGGVVDADHAQLAALRFLPRVAGHRDANGAIAADLDIDIVRLELDRAVLPEHGEAFRGDELASVVDLKAAVAGVALTGRRLHGE